MGVAAGVAAGTLGLGTEGLLSGGGGWYAGTAVTVNAYGKVSCGVVAGVLVGVAAGTPGLGTDWLLSGGGGWNAVGA